MAGRCFLAFHRHGFVESNPSSTASPKTAFTESATFLSDRGERGLEPSARSLPESDRAYASILGGATERSTSRPSAGNA